MPLLASFWLNSSAFNSRRLDYYDIYDVICTNHLVMMPKPGTSEPFSKFGTYFGGFGVFTLSNDSTVNSL